MTKFLISLLLFIALPAQAAPFLVCDPFPTNGEQPTEFVIVIDNGTEIVSPAVTSADGSKYMKYDLAALPKGRHVVKAKARNAIEESTWSTDYFFGFNPPPNVRREAK